MFTDIKNSIESEEVMLTSSWGKSASTSAKSATTIKSKTMIPPKVPRDFSFHGLMKKSASRLRRLGSMISVGVSVVLLIIKVFRLKQYAASADPLRRTGRIGGPAQTEDRSCYHSHSLRSFQNIVKFLWNIEPQNKEYRISKVKKLHHSKFLVRYSIFSYFIHTSPSGPNRDKSGR